MSVDTGAREPQENELLVPFETTVREALEKGERDDRLLSGRDFDESVWRLAENALAALAAGVGVPPPENQDLGCAPAKERQDARELLIRADSMLSLLHHRGYIDYSKPHAPDRYDVDRLIGELRQASGASAAEGRKPNPEPAGVGVARPAEPELLRSHRNDDGTIDLWFSDGTHLHAKRSGQDSVSAPAEEQPDAREQRQSEKWRQLYYRALDERDDERAECARLREQLDAARQALAAMVAQFDATQVTDENWRAFSLARAALGDVAAGETSVSALDQRAVESRGEAEA